MNCEEKCNFTACSCGGVLISVIVGAIIGVLFAFGILPLVVIAIAISLVIALLTLIFLFSAIFTNTTSPSYDLTKCLCKNTSCLLVGIFGTIILSLILLSTIIIPIFIPVIVLVAIWAFFLSLLIIGIIAFISCIVCKMCNE